MHKILIIIMIFCTALELYRLGSYLIDYFYRRHLRSHLNEGSDNYLTVKSQIETCIRSGELNYYYEGFQLSRVDRSQDSNELKELQSGSKTLTEGEKYKIKIFSINLINEINSNKSE